MEITILLAINEKLYREGLITKEEKEQIDMEILETE